MFRDPSGNIGPLGIAAIFAAVGGTAGGIGSIGGQMLRNYVCGNNIWDIDWKDVGIAVGVGAVAGAVYPFASTVPGGHIALGAFANTAQYGISEYAHGRPLTWGGGITSAGTGAVAGAIAGPFGWSAAWGSRVPHAAAANAEDSVLVNLSRAAVARTVGGATASNTSWQEIFNCACK